MAALLVFPFLLCLLSVLQLSCGACNNATSFSIQLDTLLAEYDRETMPEAPLLVTMGLHVRHATVDERASSVHMLADLIMNWNDKRLTWNSTDWGCGNALVSVERLWRPDVEVMSAATRGAESEDLKARLTSEGRISWTSRLDLTAPVELRLEDWPQDLQTIVFKFASRDHDIDEMELVLSDNQEDVAFASGGWALEGVSHIIESWSRGGSERRLASWTLKLRRQAPAHFLATATLLAAVALLMVAALALPAKERPSLYACASFTASLWLLSALVRLPRSATAPRCVASAGALCVCGAVAALLAAFVARMARLRSSTSHATPIRAYLSAATAAVNFLHISPEETPWGSAAKLTDYVFTAFLLLVLFITFCISL